MSNSPARAAFLFCLLGSTTSLAQTFTIQSVAGGNIGTVAAATSGVTVFNNGASTTTVSGSGTYVKGAVTPALITVNCANQGLNFCSFASSATVNIIRTGVNAGRGQTLQSMTVAGVGSTALGGSTTNTSGTMSFTMTGWSFPSALQFQLSAYLPVSGDDSSTATTASSQFQVGVAKTPQTPSVFTTGLVSATVQRSLRITKTSDLNFGSVIAPTSGSNTLSLDYFNYRQLQGSGNAVLVGGAYHYMSFSATGEPNTTFSASCPATFSMTGPGSPITVTTGCTAGGITYTLDGSGATSFGLGGSFPIPAGQARGAYSGSFAVTIVYD